METKSKEAQDEKSSEELTMERLPMAVSFLIDRVNELHEELTEVEKQLKLGVHRHRPWSIAEAADFLQITERKMRTMVNAMEIPCYKRCGKIYFFEDEIIKWMEESRVGTLEEQMQSYYNKRKRR